MTYDLMLERCKRLDTKAEIIQCLDDAYAVNQHEEKLGGGLLLGGGASMILIFCLVMWWVNR